MKLMKIMKKKRTAQILGDETEEARDRNFGYEIDEKNEAKILATRRKKRSITIVVMKLMKRREKK
jgi:hypothetical protein